VEPRQKSSKLKAFYVNLGSLSGWIYFPNLFVKSCHFLELNG
jgi:hypothetical protein